MLNELFVCISRSLEPDHNRFILTLSFVPSPLLKERFVDQLFLDLWLVAEMPGHCVSKHRELSPQLSNFCDFYEGHCAETKPANLKYL